VHLRLTRSTNDHARALAIAGAPHGTLVSAEEQSAGRGRQGRRWLAPPGRALLMSVVLRDPPRLLPLVAAVGVCDALGERAWIKWPNDIVIARGGASASAGARRGESPGNLGAPPDGAPPDGAPPDGAPPGERLGKVGGILIEGRPQQGWAVVGVGLNVAVRPKDLPAELRRSAATLGEHPEAVEMLLACVLEALERRLGEPRAATLEAWRARDALRGRQVSWQEGAGRAEGIDDRGRLVVRGAQGERCALDAGEVHLEQRVTSPRQTG